MASSLWPQRSSETQKELGCVYDENAQRNLGESSAAAGRIGLTRSTRRLNARVQPLLQYHRAFKGLYVDQFITDKH